MKTIGILFLIGFLITGMLVGCETSQGVGRDVQKLGAEIEDI